MSATSPVKAAHRHSHFSSQSTFETNPLFGRNKSSPSAGAETLQWLSTPCMDSNGTSCSVKGWFGTDFVYMPGAGKAGLSYQLPVADQRGVNPTLKAWSVHRYPIITSAHFQLYQAGFRPNKTTLQVIDEAEEVAQPYVVLIKRLAQIKAKVQLTVAVVCLLCLIYTGVGVRHGREIVWVCLLLAGVLFAAFCWFLVLLNKRLRTAYEGLSASLEAFAQSKADLALRGYAVSALGPFIIHITVLSRFTVSFSNPENRQN